MMNLKELPQNLLGKLVVLVVRGTRHETCLQDVRYYEAHRFNRLAWGVSLGEYIIISGSPSLNTLKHEHGHQLQSRKYGWFYLLLVGVPSFIRNIYHRIAHKKWTTQQRINWYYSSWPEQQADELGGVYRNTLLF